jgi:putative ATPase
MITEPTAPLAERMRPRTLDEFVGQEQLLGTGRILRQLIERDRLPSAIFWGEPGSGKTTLARIIARMSDAELFELSAVSSGVGEVRKVIDAADTNRRLNRRTILFIDEIHRFNKAQQDALLHAVEDGTLTLIGATTENPSFEVISPLLSRCHVFRFQPLSPDDVSSLIDRALFTDPYLTNLKVELKPDARAALIQHSGGDARVALNGLEVASELRIAECGMRNVDLATAEETAPQKSKIRNPKSEIVIDVVLIERALMTRPGRYDKKGEYHYDTISAFIKSLRGSDPDAAVYWLARMLDAGEEPLFIARRMVILASEDVGNANPTALVLATACADAVKFIGLPEAQLTLAQTALYLASSPKSNSTLTALLSAKEDVAQNPDRPVPLHLRNAVTGLMKALNYGKGYQYAHDHDGGFAEQSQLPEELQERIYYHPSDRGAEKAIKERLEGWWGKRRK